MKEKALKLADELEALGKLSLLGAYPIADMIRKLVAELEKEKAKSVNSANSDFNNCFTKTASESLSQTKPLSNDEINKMLD